MTGLFLRHRVGNFDNVSTRSMCRDEGVLSVWVFYVASQGAKVGFSTIPLVAA